MLGSYLKKAIQEQQTYTGLRNFEWRLNSIQKTKKAVNFRGCKFTAFLFYCTFRFARSALFVLPNIKFAGLSYPPCSNISRTSFFIIPSPNSLNIPPYVQPTPHDSHYAMARN